MWECVALNGIDRRLANSYCDTPGVFSDREEFELLVIYVLLRDGLIAVEPSREAR